MDVSGKRRERRLGQRVRRCREAGPSSPPPPQSLFELELRLRGSEAVGRGVCGVAGERLGCSFGLEGRCNPGLNYGRETHSWGSGAKRKSERWSRSEVEIHWLSSLLLGEIAGLPTGSGFLKETG